MSVQSSLQDPSATAVPDHPWPGWALPQLRHAVRLAGRIESRQQRTAMAPELYRSWFNPVVGAPIAASRSPLAGMYRTAHAGSRKRVTTAGVTTVRRNDVVGRDGWWRTWGDQWCPPHSRSGSVRLLMTPRVDALEEFVATITAALLEEATPWLLACATDPRRLRRTGAAVLQVRHPDVMSASTATALHALLRPITPPLSMPWGPGIGVATAPDNGMSFGEHRCHLVALALRETTPANASPRSSPLRAIAETFAAHRIDPARPHES